MSASEPVKPEIRIPDPESTSRLHPIWIAALVTVGVTALSYKVPDEYAATAVGAAFIFAVWGLVLRRDTATIRHYGLALGWSLGLVAIVVPPFVIGFRIYRHIATPFHFVAPASIADEVFGQALVIALPEEAFYRGYLMTAL